jgi:dTDP-4-dehydrorhamnose reductase
MARVLVLGASGMLGSEVCKVLSQSSKLNVVGTVRDLSYDMSFPCRVEYFESSVMQKDFLEGLIHYADYVINCIGIIKPHIADSCSKSVQRAININSLLPHKINEVAQREGAKVIQIATDCVYDGMSTGGYIEDSKHSPTDVYGKTKSLGEVIDDNFLNLRCSIIGYEQHNKLSLVEFVKNSPPNGVLNGFTNHLWNGITTKAFANLCKGIILSDDKIFFRLNRQHIVPADVVDKYTLLKLIAKSCGRDDIKINDVINEHSIDRTLSTFDPDANEYIWRTAGYKDIPTIKELVMDM